MYCSVQQTEQLYRQWKAAAIDDEGEGGASCLSFYKDIYSLGIGDDGWRETKEIQSIVYNPRVQDKWSQIVWKKCSETDKRLSSSMSGETFGDCPKKCPEKCFEIVQSKI